MLEILITGLFGILFAGVGALCIGATVEAFIEEKYYLFGFYLMCSISTVVGLILNYI